MRAIHGAPPAGYSAPGCVALGETKGFENQDGSPDGIALDGVRCAHTILTLGFDFDVWVSPRLPRRASQPESD
jgi:hypothetical protein